MTQIALVQFALEETNPGTGSKCVHSDRSKLSLDGAVWHQAGAWPPAGLVDQVQFTPLSASTHLFNCSYLLQCRIVLMSDGTILRQSKLDYYALIVVHMETVMLYCGANQYTRQ